MYHEHMNIWYWDVSTFILQHDNSKWVNMGVASKVYWTTNEAVLNQPSYRVEKARLVGLHDGSAGEELQKPLGDEGWQSTVDGCPVGWKLGWINGDVRINGVSYFTYL